MPPRSVTPNKTISMAPESNSEQSSDNFSLNNQVQEVAAKIDQPHKFAEIFCTAASKQIQIRDTLNELIKGSLTDDKSINEHLKKVLREVQQEDWKLFFCKVQGWVWTVLTLLVGAVFGGLFTAIFGKYIK